MLREGDVARQDPQENSQLEKGKTISIWLSSGVGQVDVPNVVGLSEAQAAAKIGAAGLQVVSKPEVNPDQPVGTVLRQNPEAAQEGRRGHHSDDHRGGCHATPSKYRCSPG